MSDEGNVAQMRETIERLSKDKAGLKSENESQAKRLREYEAKDAFRDAGYNPNHGKLYAALHPEGEITEDSVVSFADEQGLPATSTQSDTGDGQEDTSGADEGSQQLGLMAGSGSRAGDGGAGGSDAETLTRQEWQELHAVDSAAAKAAIASGRVEISRDNVYGQNAPAPRGSNPYVPNVKDS